MFLARAGKYRVHGRIQSTVVLLNLVVIGGVMVPSFHRQVSAHLVSGWRDAYYAVPMIHAELGAAAILLALYVVLVAGTNMLPKRLRFQNYKAWMRATLTLWWAVVLLGAGVYYVWYVQAGAAAAPALQPTQSGTVAVSLKNFEFTPKTITVPVGTTVDWVDQGGHHAISADGKSFEGPEMSAGDHFQHKFDKAGTFAYYCRIHGEPGGKDMAGVVVVK
jgi:plastocyanin